MAGRQLVILAITAAATLGLLATVRYTQEVSPAYFRGTFVPARKAVRPVVQGVFQNARTSVYFLKTHKCASTTVQRIFMTYAMRNNLSVAIPLNSSNLFFPYHYVPEIAKRTCSHPHFDVVAAHTRFHPSALAYMRRDTFFVSIVRDPAEQMESAYYYFLVKDCKESRFKKLTFESYMSELIRKGPRDKLPPFRYPCRVDNMQFLQLYDFGLDVDARPTREVVQRKIDEIDRYFHLVLVVERLDEGLIIMRDMLGWSMEDMLNLKSNFRLGANSSLSAQARVAAYEWNWGDKMLYDHFRKKMNAMIESSGEYLRSEVRRLKNLQEAFYKNCVADEAGKIGRRNVNSKTRASIALNSYELSNEGRSNDRCRVAAMTELELFKLMNDMYPSCHQAFVSSTVATTVSRHSAGAISPAVNFSAVSRSSQQQA